MVEYGLSARMYLRIEMSCCYALSLHFRRLPERGWSWRSGLLVYPVGREVDRTAKEGTIEKREGVRRAAQFLERESGMAVIF